MVNQLIALFSSLPFSVFSLLKCQVFFSILLSLALVGYLLSQEFNDACDDGETNPKSKTYEAKHDVVPPKGLRLNHLKVFFCVKIYVVSAIQPF